MFDFLLGNDLLSAIIAFILVLIPAVLIHELGHFLAAKSVGITILEFGIGMPPRMAKLFTHGGTDYTPYEGIEVTGWPVSTMLRGKFVVRDGKLVGALGGGAYVPREKSELAKPASTL